MGAKKRVRKKTEPSAAAPGGKGIPVLIMAYGSARTDMEDGVRAYLDHIVGYYRGTTASDGEVADLEARYEAIGGSPLYEMTGRVARGVQDLFDYSGDSFDVRVAMKHSPPFIEDAVEAAAESGANHGVAVALAPFRSALTSDAYYKEVEQASEGRNINWSHPGDWHLHPLFLGLWERLIAQSLLESDGDDTVVVFTNHSLPATRLSLDDPYVDQFTATAEALAGRLGLERWGSAFQSAGKTNQPWLGPTMFEVIGDWISRGADDFVIAPVGFLVDHLEVRYDLDIEAAKMARELNVSLRRTDMPNDEAEMVALLVDLVRTAAGSTSGT